MNCKFSETQFSFCFTFEYLQGFYPLHLMPFFPNIVMEGRIGGYDVRINANNFFQFKIPTYQIKRSKNNDEWDTFKKPYYRIKINTGSQQFKLLKELKIELPKSNIYYATPEFHTEDSLANAYHYNRIVGSSALFLIQNFPKYKSGHHHLIYHKDFDYGMLFSEPLVVEKKKILNFSDFNQMNDESSIMDLALKISKMLLSKGFKTKGDISLSVEGFGLIKAVHTILLTNYNILWYPIYKFRQLSK